MGMTGFDEIMHFDKWLERTNPLNWKV